jgi:hypothetical protein
MHPVMRTIIVACILSALIWLADVLVGGWLALGGRAGGPVALRRLSLQDVLLRAACLSWRRMSMGTVPTARQASVVMLETAPPHIAPPTDRPSWAILGRLAGAGAVPQASKCQTTALVSVRSPRPPEERGWRGLPSKARAPALSCGVSRRIRTRVYQEPAVCPSPCTTRESAAVPHWKQKKSTACRYPEARAEGHRSARQGHEAGANKPLPCFAPLLSEEVCSMGRTVCVRVNLS